LVSLAKSPKPFTKLVSPATIYFSGNPKIFNKHHEFPCMDQLKDKPDNRENPQLQDDQTADSLNLRNRPFPIVGMGGSAGSFSAIVEFFEEVPEDSGIAFVLVQHLEPNLPVSWQKYCSIGVPYLCCGWKMAWKYNPTTCM
jgi:hypothetical protein